MQARQCELKLIHITPNSFFQDLQTQEVSVSVMLTSFQIEDKCPIKNKLSKLHKKKNMDL